jgi:hypothetical protein
MSSRDPNYYLQKANFFYNRSNNNPIDKKKNNFENYDLDSEFDYDYDDSECVDDYLDNVEDDFEYEYLKLEPITKLQAIVSNIKPKYSRYYDPITKHYYRSDKIFDVESAKNKQPAKNPDIWFPENKLSFKTMKDPKTGKYYRVNKIYDTDGNYKYNYDKLNKKMIKTPGTNYYRPSYKCDG